MSVDVREGGFFFALNKGRTNGYFRRWKHRAKVSRESESQMSDIGPEIITFRLGGHLNYLNH